MEGGGLEERDPPGKESSQAPIVKGRNEQAINKGNYGMVRGKIIDI